MVKINNFISTSRTNPLISSGLSSDPSLANIAQGALRAAGSKLNDELRDFENSKRASERLGAIAEERERQRKLAIPEAARSIQRSQLNTLNTFLRIDEQNRVSQENKEARAYALQTKSETDLQYVQSLEGINASAGVDGSGLFNNTKAWWDSKEKEIIDSAPSEKAKLTALETFVSAKTRALGSAVLQQDEMKKSHILGQTERTIGVINNTARAAPHAYEKLAEQFGAIEEQLRSNGFTKKQIEDNKISFHKNLLWNKSLGDLDKGNIGGVKATLSNVQNLGVLGEKYSQKLVDSLVDLENNLLENTTSQLVESNNMKRFVEGTLTPGEKGAGKIKEKYWGNLISQAEGNTNFSDPGQSSLFSGAVLANMKKANAYPLPKSVANHMGQKLLDINNPERALAYASTINLANQSVSTAHMLSNMSDKDIAIANQLKTLGSVLPPEQAIAAAKDMSLKARIDPAAKKALDDEWARETADSLTGDGKVNDLIDDTILGDAQFLEEVLDYDEPWLTFGTSFDKQSVKTFKADFKDKIKTFFYLHDGDIDQAISSAKMSVKTQFGVTTVNGQEEVMRYAPEMIFQGDNMKYFNKEKDRSLQLLKDNGVEGEFEIKPVQLQGSTAGNSFNYKVVYKGTDQGVFYTDHNGIKMPALVNVRLDSANKATEGLLEKVGIAEYEKGRSRIHQYARDTKRTILNVFGADIEKDVSISEEDIILEGDDG